MTDAAAETKTMRVEASEQDEGREVDPNEDVPTTTNVAEPNPDANPDGNEPEPEPEPEVEPHADPSLGAIRTIEPSPRTNNTRAIGARSHVLPIRSMFLAIFRTTPRGRRSWDSKWLHQRLFPQGKTVVEAYNAEKKELKLVAYHNVRATSASQDMRSQPPVQQLDNMRMTVKNGVVCISLVVPTAEATAVGIFDCSYVVAWSGYEDGAPLCDCPTCGKNSCLVCCQSPYHTGLTCDQYKATVEQNVNEENERLTEEYLKRSTIRKCRRCGNGVVKASGCLKMKCRCGYRFCFQCGSENAQCGHTPASHGFINNRGGGADFSNLKHSVSPT